jgi:hypothetical protein
MSVQSSSATVAKIVLRQPDVCSIFYVTTLMRIKIFMDEKEERLDAERREKRARKVLEKATKEQPWQNILGMKFVPVAGTQVLFNIWDTRLEDFYAFVERAGYDATEGMYSIGKERVEAARCNLEGAWV